MKNNKQDIVALIGATGKSGKHILYQLLEDGYKVRAMVRKPEKLTIKNPNLEIIQGDVLNIDDLCILLEGTKTLISALGSKQIIFSKVTANIIELKKENVDLRYIVITGLSIKANEDRKSLKVKFLSWIMRSLFKEIICDKQLEYELLAKSKINWTMIRCPLITEDVDCNQIEADLFNCNGSKVSLKELAKFVVEEIENDKNVKKAPFVFCK